MLSNLIQHWAARNADTTHPKGPAPSYPMAPLPYTAKAPPAATRNVLKAITYS